MADEVTLTQADIDKAVADAIAKQKTIDEAATDVTVGHYKVDKKWLKWAAALLLSLAYANGWLDKETVTRLITAAPMSQAPETPPEPVKAEPEPPTLAPVAAAINPDDVAKWIDIFKPLIQQIIESIPKPPIQVDPKPQPKPDVPAAVDPPAPGTLKLTLTDAAKLPVVSSSVPSGKLLVVKLEGFQGPKIDWSKRTTGDVQFYDVGNQTAAIVLTGPAELDLLVTDYGSQSQVSLRVICQQAAQPPPVVVTPQPVTPVVDNKPASPTAAWSDAVASLSTDTVVADGILTFAVRDGMPKAIADAIRAACPAIGSTPARDLTAAEVAAIRGVK